LPLSIRHHRDRPKRQCSERGGHLRDHGGADGIAIRAKLVDQSRVGTATKGRLDNLPHGRDVGRIFGTNEHGEHLAASVNFFQAPCRDRAYSVVLWSDANGRNRMLYAILCYHDEAVVGSWAKQEDDAVLAKRVAVTRQLAAAGRLGPVVRLMPTTAATTVRSGRESMVIDGPFAETKEQLLGVYVVDCATLDDAIATARDLGRDQTGAFEIRPLRSFAMGSGVK
jgi:hypothetical protein